MKRNVISSISVLSASTVFALLSVSACSNSLNEGGLSESSDAGGGRSGVAINGGSLGDDGDASEDQDGDGVPDSGSGDGAGGSALSGSLSRLALTLEYESQQEMESIESVSLTHCPAAADVGISLAFRFSKNDCLTLGIPISSSNPANKTAVYRVDISESPILLKDLHDLKWTFKPKAGSELTNSRVAKLDLAGKMGNQSGHLYLDAGVDLVKVADGTYTLSSSRSSIRVEEDSIPDRQGVTLTTERRFQKLSDVRQISGSFLNRHHGIVSRSAREDLNLNFAMIKLQSFSVNLGGRVTQHSTGPVGFDASRVRVLELGTGISRSGSRSNFSVTVGQSAQVDLDVIEQPGQKFFPVE